MSPGVPGRCRVVVIGGGIVGCSTAYHLAKQGVEDVVLLEKAQLTSGSTWHAAGSVGQLRASAGLTEMISYSTQLYGLLEKETGLATGWRQCGSIRLACTPERHEELLRSQIIGRSFGLEIEMISLEEVAKRIPAISLEGVLSAAYIPTDGLISPSDVTMSLAKGARLLGARIFENTAVTGFRVSDGHVRAVETSSGVIECEKLVLCGGIWARELGKLAGVNVPLQANYAQYGITDVISGISRDTPDLRDPDNHLYYKEEVGGLAFGDYDQNPTAFDTHPIPDDHAYRLYEPDMDKFMTVAEEAMNRFPALGEVGIKEFINGLEAYTDDGMPIMGRAPELQNFFVACGFNGFGIACGGGAGKAMAQWTVDGYPQFELSAADIRRFAGHHGSDDMVRILATEGQRRHYALERPEDESRLGRFLRRSPVHAHLVQAGAHLSPTAGWEIPDYFEGSVGESAKQIAVREWEAAKSGIGIADDSARAKILVTGPGSEQALQNICSADIGKEMDCVVPSLMLNERGGIECAVVVSRHGQGNFLVTTSPSASGYLLSHLQGALLAYPGVEAVDVTAAGAIFIVYGSDAVEFLQPITEGAIELPPFGRMDAFVAGVPAQIVHTTPVMAPGYELHVSSEYAQHAFEALMSSKDGKKPTLVGSKAQDLLRIEHGFPRFPGELNATVSPIEAGLEDLVAFEKADGFVGKDELRRQSSSRRLYRLFVRDCGYIPSGAEPVLQGDRRVGFVSSIAYSPTVGGTYVLAYVDIVEGGGSLSVMGAGEQISIEAA